jgi:NAD(P)H-hydrate repair Nnr-like enzyme with NAD(P)H-hydrate epimerase domain
LVAARLLHEWARASGGCCEVVVTLYAETSAPADAARALTDARNAGVQISALPPQNWDLGIDALLGIGVMRTPAGQLDDWLNPLHRSPSPCLCVDVPAGWTLTTATGTRRLTRLPLRQQACSDTHSRCSA